MEAAVLDPEELFAKDATVEEAVWWEEEEKEVYGKER